MKVVRSQDTERRKRWKEGCGMSGITERSTYESKEKVGERTGHAKLIRWKEIIKSSCLT